MAKLLIPYANFAVTAMVLSDRHLRENIRETIWAHSSARGVLVGWGRHPLVVEWAEHLDALLVLHDCCVRALYQRGRQSRSHLRLGDEVPTLPGYSVPENIGNFRFHATQRSQLLFLDHEWYSQWGWTDEPGRV